MLCLKKWQCLILDPWVTRPWTVYPPHNQSMNKNGFGSESQFGELVLELFVVRSVTDTGIEVESAVELADG